MRSSDGTIKLRRTPGGDYVCKGPCGSLQTYTGEDARILDVLFKYQGKSKLEAKED